MNKELEMNLDVLLQYLFEHQFKIKLYHFQTKNYGAHKASDKYSEKFRSNLDRLFEVAQGIFGKTGIEQVEFKFQTLDDTTIFKELDDLNRLIKEYRKKYESEPDMIVVFDDILADANQLKYLLTFK